jgi:hypothetical protein
MSFRRGTACPEFISGRRKLILHAERTMHDVNAGRISFLSASQRIEMTLFFIFIILLLMSFRQRGNL